LAAVTKNVSLSFEVPFDMKSGQVDEGVLRMALSESLGVSIDKIRIDGYALIGASGMRRLLSESLRVNFTVLDVNVSDLCSGEPCGEHCAVDHCEQKLQVKLDAVVADIPRKYEEIKSRIADEVTDDETDWMVWVYIGGAAGVFFVVALCLMWCCRCCRSSNRAKSQ
jgi:hypothetical protein